MSPRASSTAAKRHPLHVAVGLILHPTRRMLLLRKRSSAPGIEFPGQWGFPGGKIERGETGIEALVRECQEEVAVTPLLTSSMGSILFLPPETKVTCHLHYYFVHQWRGGPEALEPDTEIVWSTMKNETLPLTIGTHRAMTRFARILTKPWRRTA